MPGPDLSYLDPGDGRRIAYRLRAPADPRRPTIMFLPGYASDMSGTKAAALDAFAEASGCGCLLFDYSGTGASAGRFDEATLKHWLDELLAVIDQIARGRLILVGSSMGGWLMLHAALRRPNRIAGLIGVAAAPDFTDWGFTPEDKIALLQAGRLQRGEHAPPSPTGADAGLTTRAFWQSGEALRLLGEPIAIDCPVRLLHGDADDVVPIGVPLKLLAQLTPGDVQLTLVKGGGHRLSEPREIAALLRLVVPLAEPA